MRIYRYKKFGNVSAWELGWSPAGRPIMTVHVFIAGHVMIDTGCRHVRKQVCEIAEAHNIKAVLLTHSHEDHSGNAAAVQRLLDVPVFAHPLACRRMENPHRIRLYQHLMWGAAESLSPKPLPDSFVQDGYRFQPIHTPGHSRDHTAFLEPNHGWLFSGDLYLGECIKYFRADENIAEQIKSIRKILGYDFDSLFCAHRPEAANGRKRLASKLHFLESFYARVSELAGKGLNEKEIMKRLSLKEERFIKFLTFGNVSMKNMVRSVIKTQGETGL